MCVRLKGSEEGGKGRKEDNSERGADGKKFLTCWREEKKKKPKGKTGEEDKRDREREGEGLGCKMIGGQDGKKTMGLGDKRASNPTVLEG